MKRLREQEEARRQAASAAIYGKYEGMEPAALVDVLCADFIKNPEPAKDRRNVQLLKERYAASGQDWRGLVDAFRAAGQAGAYSVRWVMGGITTPA